MQDKWQSYRIQLYDIKAENCTYRYLKLRQYLRLQLVISTQKQTGMSVVCRMTAGTCLADSSLRMLIWTCLISSALSWMPVAIFRNSTTLSSLPSQLFCATQRLSWTSLKLSTTQQPQDWHICTAFTPDRRSRKASLYKQGLLKVTKLLTQRPTDHGSHCGLLVVLNLH